MGSPPNSAYSFEHLLTRDAAYDALLGSNRRALHGAAARVLIERIVPGTPGELALLGPLIAHLEAAGRFAEAHQYSCTQVVRHATLGHLQGWEADVARAQRLWDMARAQQPQLPEFTARVANCRALCLTHTGRLDEARVAANSALEQARAEDDLEQIPHAYNSLGIAAHYAGQHDLAFEMYDLAIAGFRAVLDEVGVARGCNNLGIARFEIGDTAGALAILREGLAIAEAQDHAQLQANLGLNVGLALHDLGQSEPATAQFKRWLAVARDIGSYSSEAIALGYLGELQEQAGHPASARDYYSAALRLTHITGSARFVGWWLAHLGELDLKAGDIDTARGRTLEALACAQRSGGLTVEAYILCQLGQIERAAGHLPGACDYLRQAEACEARYGGGERWRLSGKLRALRRDLGR